MKKIENIIIINDYAHINGGAAKVAIQSAIGLSEKGLNVVFFSAVGPIDNALKKNTKVVCLDQKDSLNCENKIKGAMQGLWNFKASTEIKKLLKEYSPNDTVVHIHGWTKALSSSVFHVLKNDKFSVFVTLHDYFTTCPNGAFYDYSKKCLCDKKPLSVKCICCNCDKRNYFFKIYRIIRQFIQDQNVKKNHDLIYIYISHKNYTIAKKWLSKNAHFIEVINPIELYNNKMDTTNAKKNFLYIGRLSHEKGSDLFCQAITKLKKSGIVIGDGEMRSELEEKYKNICFTGWLSHEEIENYILDASALIFSSRCYEGAPLTIVEMLSSGLPCIVSDVTSATELISNEKNGYVFKSDDLNDLCEAIKKLTPEKELSLKINIKRDFERNEYSLENHVERLLDIYNRQKD